MTPINTTVWDIEPHTRAKHEILRNYLEAWFPILTRYEGRIVYLDGFAGPGIYAGGEQGSPVIAIRTAQEHKLRVRFQAELVYWFIEKDQARAQKLREVLKGKFPSLPANWRYEVQGAEFAPTLEATLTAIEKEGARLAPTFAFLDPFGFSGLPMRLIARMLAYKKCEVLITFVAGFINRFTDELREAALDEFFDTPEWRKIRQISEPKARIDFLIELYERQLRDRARAKHVRSFEMIGRNNQVIYYLVYGTKHWKGLEVMKEAMWQVDRRGTYRFSDVTDPGQRFIIDYSDESRWQRSAGQAIFAQFRGKTVSIDEIRQFVVTETPYNFRKSVLRTLEESSPAKIQAVFGRQKRLTYPDECRVKFVL